jgi:hypothetical protein
MLIEDVFEGQRWLRTRKRVMSRSRWLIQVFAGLKAQAVLVVSPGKRPL